MHGVKRTRVSAEARAERKAKEQGRLHLYLKVENSFFEATETDTGDEATLELTGKLLSVNPEHYTSWNFRRRVLHGLFADREAVAQQRLLDADLQLTEAALRSHPKVYWIWNHRKWCLEEYPAKDKWRREMGLVDVMLDLDGRNFHGWDYRRYLLAQMARGEEADSREPPPAFPQNLSLDAVIAELAYTLRKIEKDFSNFSAWHQRQLLFQRQWELKDSKEQDLAREFELVQQAMYTDPSDQSVWLYHRWLIEQDPRAEVLHREIAAVEELLELEPESKWCMQSIVHYRALRRRQEADDAHQDLAEEKRLLEALVRIDPDRRRRYEDELRARLQ